MPDDNTKTGLRLSRAHLDFLDEAHRQIEADLLPFYDVIYQQWYRDGIRRGLEIAEKATGQSMAAALAALDLERRD